MRNELRATQAGLEVSERDYNAARAKVDELTVVVAALEEKLADARRPLEAKSREQFLAELAAAEPKG